MTLETGHFRAKPKDLTNFSKFKSMKDITSLAKMFSAMVWKDFDSKQAIQNCPKERLIRRNYH